MENITSYIGIDTDVRFGKPVIKGTRITVADVLKSLPSGMSHAEIIADFPLIKEEHILGALAFAADRESIIKIIAA